jgi:DNA primase
MFPIHDRRGRVIAFGGRVLGKDDGPKYLNSPETPLFHKGRELYGLWQVRQAHSKIPRLIVVEGYMDVVALFQYGINTAVATLGTATTADHAELLFRNAADVYFCFDGDKAGRGAAWKALESVLPRMKDGRQAHFVFLPEGEDPDTLLRAQGAAGFDAQLQAAQPLSEFLFAELSRDIRIDTLDGRARLAERCKPLLAQIPDGSFRDLMHQRMDELTGMLRNPAPAPPTSRAMQRPPRGAAPSRPSLVRTAIALLLQQPRLAESVPPPYAFAALQQPGVPLLIELLALCAARPGINTGVLLDEFAEREEGAALRKLAMQEFPGDEPAWRAMLLEGIDQLNRLTLQQRRDALRAKQASEGLDDAEKDELRQLLTVGHQKAKHDD